MPRKETRRAWPDRHAPRKADERTTLPRGTPRKAAGCTARLGHSPRKYARRTMPSSQMPRKACECTNAPHLGPRNSELCTIIGAKRLRPWYRGRTFSARIRLSWYTPRFFSAQTRESRRGGQNLAALQHRAWYSRRCFSAPPGAKWYTRRLFSALAHSPAQKFFSPRPRTPGRTKRPPGLSAAFASRRARSQARQQRSWRSQLQFSASQARYRR